MDLNRPRLRFFVSRSTARNSSQGRGGSRSPLRVRPMEEGRKSSLSYRPAALPKPFCSERLRIDWNNRCALVRVILC
jgi:hypothetical protein